MCIGVGVVCRCVHVDWREEEKHVFFKMQMRISRLGRCMAVWWQVGGWWDGLYVGVDEQQWRMESNWGMKGRA